MKLKIFLALAFILLAAVCLYVLMVPSANEPQNNKPLKVVFPYSYSGNTYPYNIVEGTDYIILPYDPDELPMLKYEFGKVKPAELTNDELKKINDFLHEAVYKYNAYHADEQIDLSRYNRQYIAVTNEKEEKEVFINCFLKKGIQAIGWKKRFVHINDGGKIRFKVKINLTRQIITMFSVNGIA